MAEKLTIKKWFDEEDGLPERYADDGTYLGTHDQGYDICEDGSTQVGWANDLDVARFFAASPLMLEALDMAYAEIFRLITTSRMIQESHTHDSGEVLKTIAAAIAAAKGE